MDSLDAKTDQSRFSAAEWALRVDLAAAHRIAHMQGFSEGIFNHLTARSPSREAVICLPFGTHWSEASAGALLTVDFNGALIDGAGDVERSTFCIHTPIHKMRPDAACVFHTHMPFASALTRLEDPRLKPIGQTEISYINDIAYDMDYTGFARDPAEGERLGKILGSKNILFMANHGVLVLGRSVAETYDRLYYLERACQVQLYAMWTEQTLKTIPVEIIARTTQQFGNIPRYAKPHYELHFDALKRLLKGPPQRQFDE